MKFYYNPYFASGFVRTIDCFKRVMQDIRKLNMEFDDIPERELHSASAGLLKRLENPSVLLNGLEPGYNQHLIENLDSIERMLKVFPERESFVEFGIVVEEIESEEEVIGGIFGCLLIIAQIERVSLRTRGVFGCIAESLGKTLIKALKDCCPFKFPN